MRLFLLFVFLFTVNQAVPAVRADLRTTAELSEFRRTGKYEEVLRLCSEFQHIYPKQVRCFVFGKTPEGRPMVALAVSGIGALDSKRARSIGNPVLLLQGGIHSGEIDGKDAGFWWLKEALGKNADVLKKVTLVFVPVFNIDGHERFGPNNRPNQIGPEEMGWRVTAQNLNLNRDYMKAEAPEMAAMLGLLNAWDPILYVDMHVTDGAQFQHSVSLNFQPSHRDVKVTGAPQGLDELDRLSAELEEGLKTDLDQKGYLPVTVYPDFVREDEPASGIADGFATPRFSHGYWGLRNRIGFLLETHSWKDYATRVKITRDTLDYIIGAAARDGKSWLSAAEKADDFTSHELSGKDLVIRYENTRKSGEIDFQGYAYKRESSPVSGGMRIVYDPSRKQVWKIPLFEELVPKITVKLPKEGYIVEAAHAKWMAVKLLLHGIKFTVIRKSLPRIELEVFRSEQNEFSAKSYEGRQTLKVKGIWKPEARTIPEGSLFIPISQPKARLIANLLEPSSEDSLLAWGFFNAHFERREYMEDYVTEQVAEKMLAQDPKLKSEFDQKLKEDAEFAKSPSLRLEYFYRLHPSWDERFGLYPVFKLPKRLEYRAAP
jgi:hypothetical protein